MSSEAPRGNVGDWSELYTVAYLLVHGGAFAADENQVRQESSYHKVLQLLIADSDFNSGLKYEIRNDTVIIYESGAEVRTISREQIREKMNIFFRDLTNGKHVRHFSLSSGESLLDLLNKKRIKASSAETENDVELILEDSHTKIQNPAVGFSIKSQLGSASTLLNSSGSTNLIYKIHQKSGNEDIPFPSFIPGSHKKNLQKLFAAGYELNFFRFQSDTFARNLQLLDSNMGEYIGKILLTHYSSNTNKFSDVVEASFPANEAESRQPIFKIKEFLGAISMGMRPATEWDGDTTKFKGIILVKKDGEIVFYYLHNRKSFEDYLFKNVRFDRPDTGRHQYGSIYEENGEHFLKLNLQIRFKR